MGEKSSAKHTMHICVNAILLWHNNGRVVRRKKNKRHNLQRWQANTAWKPMETHIYSQRELRRVYCVLGLRRDGWFSYGMSYALVHLRFTKIISQTKKKRKDAMQGNIICEKAFPKINCDFTDSCFLFIPFHFSSVLFLFVPFPAFWDPSNANA